jgi:hypothetical protein
MSDPVSDNIGPPESGAWLTLADAARFYRVTIRTLDRRKLSKRRLPGRPVEVWVEGATETDVSDTSETPDGQEEHPDDRAVALTERVSDAIGRQIAALVSALERLQERNAELERENGVLSERLDAVGRVSDADRQRLTAELEAARSILEIRQAELAAEHEAKSALVASGESGRGDAPRGARDQPLANVGAMAAGDAGDRRGGHAAGVAEVTGRIGTRSCRPRWDWRGPDDVMMAPMEGRPWTFSRCSAARWPS